MNRLKKAEISLLGFGALKTEYNLMEKLSTDKEASKRVMIYYAAPKPDQYGYFVATDKKRRDEWLQDRYRDCLDIGNSLIWC